MHVEGAGNSNFVLAKYNGRMHRFKSLDDVPDTAGEPISMAELSTRSDEDLVSIYGEVAGVSPKKFKNREIAVQSIIYQVQKMQEFDPNKPLVKQEVKTRPIGTADGGSAPVPKSSGKITILEPENMDNIVRGLAPQARELVAILLELAQKEGSLSIPFKDFHEALMLEETKVRLHTRQSPDRIFQYYRSKLTQSGLIKIGN